MPPQPTQTSKPNNVLGPCPVSMGIPIESRCSLVVWPTHGGFFLSVRVHDHGTWAHGPWAIAMKTFRGVPCEQLRQTKQNRRGHMLLSLPQISLRLYSTPWKLISLGGVSFVILINAPQRYCALGPPRAQLSNSESIDGFTPCFVNSYWILYILRPP